MIQRDCELNSPTSPASNHINHVSCPCHQPGASQWPAHPFMHTAVSVPVMVHAGAQRPCGTPSTHDRHGSGFFVGFFAVPKQVSICARSTSRQAEDHLHATAWNQEPPEQGSCCLLMCSPPCAVFDAPDTHASRASGSPLNRQCSRTVHTCMHVPCCKSHPSHAANPTPAAGMHTHCNCPPGCNSSVPHKQPATASSSLLPVECYIASRPRHTTQPAASMPHAECRMQHAPVLSHQPARSVVLSPLRLQPSMS